LRRTALFFCALFIIAILTASAYTITHSNHTHDRAGPAGACATCLHLQSAAALLQTISTAIIIVSIASVSFAFALLLLNYTNKTGGCSLVTLKVRLNN
jgi:hypothetical protein